MSRSMITFAAPALIMVFTAAAAAQVSYPDPKFEAQTIDDGVQIGYGVAIGDVDGDGKDDILLADKKQFVWYRNPDWKKFVMVENLTDRDNVCIAARDIDGDGKVEVAVGAQWNPGETSDEAKSGSVHYLIPPADRTQRWTPVKLHHEPTVHRMRWVRGPGGKYQLVVAPLHGRGNKRGEGAGVRTMAYDVPDDPRGNWTTHVIEDTMHMTHNFDPIELSDGENHGIVLAGREALKHIEPVGSVWSVEHQIDLQDSGGAGEVRIGRARGEFAYVTAIQPMHGNELAVFMSRRDEGGGQTQFSRIVVDDTLAEGHALACADLLGIGVDQIVAGWRKPDANNKVGIRLYGPLDRNGSRWKQWTIDDNRMACEDLRIGDLDGDGRADIVAAGRATKNLIIYWNKTP